MSNIKPFILRFIKVSPFAIAAATIVFALLFVETPALAQSPISTPVSSELPTDDPPVNFSVQAYAHDWITIQWNVPRDRGISKYTVKGYEHNGSQFVSSPSLDVEDTASGGYSMGYHYFNLTPDTLYKFTLSLIDDADTIIISDSLTVRTLTAPDYSDATLSSLSLSNVDFGTFDPATTSYSASVTNSVSETFVAPTVDSTNGATFVISANGVDYPSFTIKKVLLNVGSNTIQVKVTSSDGSATKTYTVTVTREASNATSTPTPTATNTPEPTKTATTVPGATATNTPEPTPTVTATTVTGATATNTPTPTATNTYEPKHTNTPTPTATNTPEPTHTNTPTPTATNTPEPTPTNTPEPTKTATPITPQVPDAVLKRISTLETLVAKLQGLISALTDRIVALETIEPTPEPTPTATTEPTPSATLTPTATTEPTATATPIAAACIKEITTDGAINGSWSAACPSVNRDNRYARFYTFTIEPDPTSSTTKKTIKLTSEEVDDTYLYLLKGAGIKGDVVAENDDYATLVDTENCSAPSGLDRYDACITAPLQPGKYTIEATTYYADKSGDFTLTVADVAAQPPAAP